MSSPNANKPLESSSPQNKLREFFNNLPAADRDLVVATLDLQITRRPALSEKERQSKLEASILKQVQ